MIEYRHFIYMQDHAFLFAYVPKVACTNWKAVLRQLSGCADYLDCNLAHDRRGGDLVYLSERPDRDALLQDPALRRFAFVRNPYTRLLSAYLNKIEPLNHGDPDWIGPAAREAHRAAAGFAGQAPDAAVGFGDFAHWIAASGHALARNEHWLPQSAILAPAQVHYDFIGRFERLREDAPHLLALMGAKIPFPTREQLDFPGTGAGSRVADYYTETIAATVAAAYADDFRDFGYSTALPG